MPLHPRPQKLQQMEIIKINDFENFISSESASL
jgi:hypothetical protein